MERRKERDWQPRLESKELSLTGGGVPGRSGPSEGPVERVDISMAGRSVAMVDVLKSKTRMERSEDCENKERKECEEKRKREIEERRIIIPCNIDKQMPD